MTTSLLSAVFARLEAAVFRRRPDGSFELASEAPPWLRTLLPANPPAGSVRLEGLFSFLDNFLEDAADHWRGAAPLTHCRHDHAQQAGVHRRGRLCCGHLEAVRNSRSSIFLPAAALGFATLTVSTMSY